MRILLAGHFSFFLRTLRNRFRKEGHEVYWLSGADYQKRKEKNFKWQYDFGFESPSMPEIIGSASPDVVIFLGAHDPYYGDFSDSEKSRSYISGLLNILQTTYNSRKNTKFIYLSSEEVFAGNEDGLYDESVEPVVYDSRGKAIRQGELAALSFKESFGADVKVLRIDHLYGIPESWEDMPYVLAPMMRQALHEQRIDVRENTGYGMLSEEDASFFTYRIATSDSKRDVYHLGTVSEISEADTGRAINQGFGGSLTVEEHDYGNAVHKRLDPMAFDTEFETQAFHNPVDDIAGIAAYIYKNKKQFDENTASHGAGIKEGLLVLLGLLVPFIENAIVFVLFFFLNNRFLGGSFFSYVDFYLIYVLIFAVAFGQQQAAFSAILATFGFIYQQAQHMTGFEVIVDYNTYVWIAQIFIVGLVVGNLKDQITRTKDEGDRQNEYLKSRLTDVETVNTANVRIKGVLEKQIINQDDSLGKIYQITSQLDNSSPVEVLFDAAQVVGQLMDSRDVAVYQVANGDYARLFASTSEIARSLGNSVKYTSYKDMYEAIRDKKVFINKTMDDDLPMMASGVWEGRKLDVIIMIWGMDWEDMTLANADKLTVIGLLIQNAIAQSTRYIDALREQRYAQGLDVLTDSAFETLLGAFVNAKKKGLTDMTLMCVNNDEPLEQTAPLARKQLRSSDYMGATNKGRLLILLSNTDYKNALRVQKRLSTAGLHTQIVGEI